MNDPLDHVRQILSGEIETPAPTLRCDNTSGHPGVYKTRSGKWRAELRVAGKKYNLGTYADISDAIQARQDALDNTGLG